MTEIIFYLLIYSILIGVSLVLVGWYFKFMLNIIFERKLNSIDYVVENGRLGPERFWAKHFKLGKRNEVPFILKPIITCQRIYIVNRINSLIRFVERNEFMTQEDKDAYSAELTDVRNMWKKRDS